MRKSKSPFKSAKFKKIIKLWLEKKMISLWPLRHHFKKRNIRDQLCLKSKRRSGTKRNPRKNLRTNHYEIKPLRKKRKCILWKRKRMKSNTHGFLFCHHSSIGVVDH